MNEQLNIKQLQELMKKNQLSAVEITTFYLERIKEIDKTYNAVFMINPDALADAAICDKERQSGYVRSKMHGIPVLLKDNINTTGKQTTTAGATILKDHIAVEDASLVKQLRAQGAIILGKTNLTEFACFKTFTGVNGYSSLGGQVIYPWDEKEDPSGSSTGSAVAMSLRLAPVAIGTETGGSIMSPSMRNGIIGLKPTIGLVPRTGIIPISHTLDTAGPMSNDVYNLAVLLSSMKMNDKQDEVTCHKDDTSIDYTTYLKTNNVKKIGIVSKSGYPIPEGVEEAFNKTCERLNNLGYELIDVEIPEVQHIYDIMKYEFKHTLNTYLKKEGLSITLADIIKHNQTHEKENLKYGQKVLIEAQDETSGLMNEKDYLLALAERNKVKQTVENLFKLHNIDMLHVLNYTSVGPECGFPTLTLPIGFNQNKRPIGTYFLAPYWQEGHLIEVAHKLQTYLNLETNPLKIRH